VLCSVSSLKGWTLLAIVGGSFAPSKEFEPYLLSYCASHKDDGHDIGKAARYAMGRIIKTTGLGPRREVRFDTCPLYGWVIGLCPAYRYSQ
jgi:hypothetical protein